ncbi:hypothetical protein H4R21_002481, partial [Coemansia helicoidea]
MSQQGHWKASALATTFASGAGFAGTAWGAARQPLHLGGGMGFGLGFGQGPAPPGIADELSVAPDPAARRQKRKASSEDEAMESSSPTPEPAARRPRCLDPRLPGPDAEDPVAAVINSASAGRRAGGGRK